MSNITQTPHISHTNKLEVFLQNTIRISLSKITQTPHMFSHTNELEVFFCGKQFGYCSISIFRTYLTELGKSLPFIIHERCLVTPVLLWAPAAVQNHQMSSMRWLKVVKSCYQNHYFAKMGKQFFRYHDGINPAYCLLKDCCGRLQLHKTTK